MRRALFVLVLLLAGEAYGAAEFGKVRTPLVPKVLVFKGVSRTPTQIVKDAPWPAAPAALSSVDLSAALRAMGAGTSELPAPNLALSPHTMHTSRGFLVFDHPLSVYAGDYASFSDGSVDLYLVTTKLGKRYLLDWSVTAGGTEPVTFSISGWNGTQTNTVSPGGQHILVLCDGNGGTLMFHMTAVSVQWLLHSVTAAEVQ